MSGKKKLHAANEKVPERAAFLTTNKLNHELKPNPADAFATVWKAATEAGIDAANACIPKPMHVIGSQICLEGECGGVAILLGRGSSFARWATRQGHARRRQTGDIEIYWCTPTQSADRAFAFGLALSRSLVENGIRVNLVERLVD